MHAAEIDGHHVFGARGPLDPSRLLEGDLRSLNAASALPSSVKAEFARITRTEVFDLADPGAAFRMTDGDPRDLPRRRLVLAAMKDDRVVIHYEKGGIAHGYYLVVFDVSKNAKASFIWGAGVVRKASSLQELRSWLKSGQYDDSPSLLW